MRLLLFSPILFFAATLSVDARAQGVFDMSTLTNTLSAPTRPSAGGAARPPAAPAASGAAFRFTPSLELRKRNYAQFIEKTRAATPQGADELQKLFAQKDVIAEITPALAGFGLRTDDVADAMTVYWLNAWMASRGRSDQNSKEQAQAVRRQAANAIAATGQIATLNDARKQEMAEAFLIQAMLLEAMTAQAKADPAKMAQVQASARTGAKAMSLDLDAMELTPTGFVLAKR
ncbi:hypothetical protein PX554_17940 [Sphingomonas sp. H39-1-10]|uniref:DUF6683 family protein n=1 Tax=Sphingomonas pollutisoli TaxID=3030829 RepID=UPI0023B9F92E|nr:DUF6683 family protein [Sphingomonas pollutisoli]MDF0490020.1 hypothetical protein [Sphingomonas pollutisoli]